MSTRPRTTRERLGAVGLGLVVLVALLEIGLRLAGSFYDKPAPTPAGADLSQLGDHVILAVGDSMTWGIGASEGMTWPEQLDGLLDHANPSLDFAVINGSMAGANSTMIRGLLEEYLPIFDPEIVVILAGGSNNTNYFGFHAWHHNGSLAARLDDWLYGLRSYRLLRSFGRTGLAPAVGGQDVILDGASGSLRAYEHWLRRSGREPSPAFEEGGALLRVGRFEEALAVFEAAAREHPDDASLYWGQAMALVGKRDKPAAVQAYERCVQLEPSNPACPFGLGELWLEGLPQHAQGHPSLLAAEHWFYRGVEADPSFAGNHWGQGMVHGRCSQASQAFDAFMRCAQADPDDTRCFPSMGTMAEMSQRPDDLRIFLKGLAGRSCPATDLLEMMENDHQEPDLLAWARSDLEAMIDAAQASGAQVVLANYPYHNNTNTLFAALSVERGVPYADNHTRFQEQLATGVQRSDLFIADDAHCTDRGYGLMAAVVHDTLRSSALVPR